MILAISVGSFLRIGCIYYRNSEAVDSNHAMTRISGHRRSYHQKRAAVLDVKEGKDSQIKHFAFQGKEMSL